MAASLSAAAALLVVATAAYACSCAPLQSQRERYNKGHVIFIGTVIGEPSGSKNTYSFKIIESLKGTTTSSVVNVNGGTVGMCGMAFYRGQTYLVFAGNSPKGELFTSGCSSNRKLTSLHEDDAEISFYRTLSAADCTPITGKNEAGYPRCTRGHVPVEYVVNPTDVEKTPFRDVGLSHRYFEAITYLRARGVVSASPNNTFRPNDFVTRAEFAKMIALERLDSEKIHSCLATVEYDEGPNAWYTGYDDVPDNAWFAPYICEFRGLGFVFGTTSMKTLNPSAPVTMDQAAFFLHDIYNLIHPSLDLSEIQQNISGHMKQMKKEGLLPSSYRSPNQKLTRGELAEILWKLRQSGYYTDR